MIWLTWRQFRISAVSVLGALLLAGAVLAATGPALADLLRVSGKDFFIELGFEDWLPAGFLIGTAAAFAVPAIVGAFWGAPMVARELEAGTHRLVWTQSVSRTRWLAAKLAVTGLGAVAAGSIGLAMTWWTRPLDDAVARGLTDNSPLSIPRLWPDFFGSRGLYPLALTLLALAIGVAWGIFVRRTLVAMALTLVSVVAIQIAMPVFVQPHLLNPEVLTTEITAENLTGLSLSGEPGDPDPRVERIQVSIDEPGSWITQNLTVDAGGEPAGLLPTWAERCAGIPGRDDATVDACFTRLADEGYRQQVSYLPASRYWALQALEAGILLALTAGAVGLCFWRIRRDL
jgi:hypothetical protein